MRVFADAYGWSDAERSQLPQIAADGAVLSWARMKERAETEGGGWARMWNEGVGEVILRRRDWLLANERRIVAALVS